VRRGSISGVPGRQAHAHRRRRRDLQITGAGMKLGEYS
jgi:hypothetical protein